MDQARVPFQRIVFVCINERPAGEACCLAGGSQAIFEALKERVAAAGLKGRVRVSRSGCHDVCAQGPSVMVFPEYRWFHHVTAEDVPEILAFVRQPPAETTRA